VTCGKPSSSPWLPWLLAALFFAAGISQVRAESAGTPSSSWPPPNGSSPSTEQTQTDPWESFDSLWNELKIELSQSEQDWQLLHDSLGLLRIEADGLRSSWTESTRLYEQSEADRLNEREQAQTALRIAIERGAAAERSRDLWRTGALVVLAVAVIEAAIIAAAIALR
jgi:hypothetical protein